MNDEQKHKFEDAVAWLRKKYGSHNKAALAVGLSRSGYKYLVQNQPRPKSTHTKEWVVYRAVALGMEDIFDGDGAA